MNSLGYPFERILCGLFDVQGSAEAQVAQYVENEVVAPFGKVPGLGPVSSIAINKKIVPSVNVLLDEGCGGPNRSFSENRIQNSPFLMVEANVAGIDSVHVPLVSLPEFVTFASLYI